MKRLIDICISSVALLVFAIPMIVIILCIVLESSGGALFVQRRSGKHDEEFDLYKFRSMHTDTPDVATHLLVGSDSYITRTGKFIRKYSLDELPQLWNILKGDMSIVGPRPALHSQEDLRNARNKFGIAELKPGLTGWAQINGRDDISLARKIDLDHYYLRHQSIWFDLKVIMMTFIAVLKGTGTNPH